MGFRSIIKSIGNAFSTYSRIPIPQGKNANWNPEDMRYTLGFFPWVGILLGTLEYLTFRFLPVPVIAKALVMAVLPLILTGGIHVDGFMDTADAFHSYGDREKKLKILSDPHIGAFAVIRVLILAGLYLAGLVVITQGPGISGVLNGTGSALDGTLQSGIGWAVDVRMQREIGLVFAGTFVLSRVASGILVLTQPSARKRGMVATLKSSVEGVCTRDDAPDQIRESASKRGVESVMDRNGNRAAHHEVERAAHHEMNRTTYHDEEQPVQAKRQYKKGNMILLGGLGLVVGIAGLIISPLMMTMALLALVFTTGWFLFGRVRPLGGITGDLAGWYLSVSECAMLLAIAVECCAYRI